MGILEYIREQWYRLAFSAFVAGITAAAVVLEFRVNYVEAAIGRYLTWHNESRQEHGQIWETVSLSEQVQEQLDDLVADRRQRVSVDERIDRIEQLIELVRERGQLLVSRDRFLEIYTRMPTYQSALIIEPVRMLELIGELEGWQSTLLEYVDGELAIYMVDGANNVLRERTLAADFVTFFMNRQGQRAFGLDTAEFGDNLYAAGDFYDAWARLPMSYRQGIPLSSDELVAWRYRLQRVGVNLENPVSGRTEIAFELSTDQGLRTVRVLGRSLAVLHLVNQMNVVSGRRPLAPDTAGFIQIPPPPAEN